jgi:hypothetical protein
VTNRVTESDRLKFIMELHKESQGDLQNKLSIEAIGRAVGLDPSQSIAVATYLAARGWVSCDPMAQWGSNNIKITLLGVETVEELKARASRSKLRKGVDWLRANPTILLISGALLAGMAGLLFEAIKRWLWPP